jgi:hypothetical protein
MELAETVEALLGLTEGDATTAALTSAAFALEERLAEVLVSEESDSEVSFDASARVDLVALLSVRDRSLRWLGDSDESNGEGAGFCFSVAGRPRSSSGRSCDFSRAIAPRVEFLRSTAALGVFF